MKKVSIVIILVISILYASWQGLNLFDNQFPYGRMWETPVIRPHEGIIPVMEAGSVPLDLGEARYKTIDSNLLVSPLSGNESEYVSEGMELYAVYCTQCHGKYLDGNGTVGQSFTPLPDDLRSPQIQTLSDGLLFKRISYGNPPDGRQPPLATTIDIHDRWKIIAYIKSLGQRKAVP